MALEDAITPVNNNEPLHDQPVVDSNGRFLPWIRNFFEAKRIQTGEILSGVNRNAENIVQLFTDYTTADGAVTSAFIAADAVVAADAESSNATLSTTLTAAYQAADTALEGDVNAYTDAQISTEQSVRAAADAAEATARETLTASVQPNPNLIPNSSGHLGVTGWAAALGTVSAVSEISSNWGQNIRMTSASWGMTRIIEGPQISLAESQEYTFSVDLRIFCTSGSLFAQIICYDSGGTSLGSAFTTSVASPNHDFDDNPDNRRSVTFTTPAGTDYCVVQFVAGSIVGEQTLGWRQAKLERGATATYWTSEEIGLESLNATVELSATAIADIEGNLLARYAIAVDGGGAGAFFSLEDGTSGPSNIILSSTEIILDGDAINFGSNTEFETTEDTFITETGGYRYRYGGPFGTSSDILQWFGADSVAQGSETKTNGVFALATDGKVYYGTAELGGAEFNITGDPLVVAEAPGSGASGTTTAYSMTVNNNSGSVTYAWYLIGPSAGMSISSSSVNNPTWTVTPGSGNVLRETWRCIAEDTAGDQAVLDIIVQISDAFP